MEMPGWMWTFFYENCGDIYFFFLFFFGEIYGSVNIFLRLSFKEHLIVNFKETYLIEFAFI